MSNIYHESREKQMDKKIHGMASSQHKNASYQRGESMQSENILKNEAVHHGCIELLAYQIYHEKGGDALDNWLQAERILKNNYHNPKGDIHVT